MDPCSVVAMDPALGDLVDRFSIQVVELLATPSEGGHEVGRLQDVQVFADRLADHVQALGQLPEALSVAGIQTIEQQTTTRVGQRLEDVHHDWLVALVSELEVLGEGVPLPVSTRLLRLSRK